MPLTTEAQVREVGGLNDQSLTGDWNLFRFNSDAELSTAIANAMAAANSWIKTRIESAIYNSADPDIQTLLNLGAAYLSLHYLVPALKARRVFGTHYAVEQEESERFAALIDVEWIELAKELLEAWIVITPIGTSYARPKMRIGPVIDPLSPDIEPVVVELEETLDRARSLSLPRI